MQSGTLWNWNKNFVVKIHKKKKKKKKNLLSSAWLAEILDFGTLFLK